MAEFTHDFFDESSREFMRGKIRRGHMIYYQCTAVLKCGKQCSRLAIQDPLAELVCKQHLPKIDVIPVLVESHGVIKRRSERLAQSSKGQCGRSSNRQVSATV